MLVFRKILRTYLMDVPLGTEVLKFSLLTIYRNKHIFSKSQLTKLMKSRTNFIYQKIS